jgi:hypothetical protein
MDRVMCCAVLFLDSFAHSKRATFDPSRGDWVVMAEPKSLFEVLEDALGGALGAVAGYHIGQRYTKQDPYLMSLAGGALGAVLSDTAKKLMSEGKKHLNPFEAHGELKAALEKNQQLIDSLKHTLPEP